MGEGEGYRKFGNNYCVRMFYHMNAAAGKGADKGEGGGRQNPDMTDQAT